MAVITATSGCKIEKIILQTLVAVITTTSVCKMILPPLVLVNGQKWVYSFAKELNKTQKQCNNDTFSWTKTFGPISYSKSCNMQHQRNLHDHLLLLSSVDLLFLPVNSISYASSTPLLHKSNTGNFENHQKTALNTRQIKLKEELKISCCQ